MTLLAIACVTLPLLRRRSEGDAVGVSESNLAVLRDQLDELKTDLANGTISTSQFEAARAELERRVLDETPKPSNAEVRRGGRLTVVALAIGIPIATLAFYLVVGSPQGLRDEVAAPPQQVTP